VDGVVALCAAFGLAFGDDVAKLRVARDRQRTRVLVPPPEPGIACSSGVMRVQITTASGSGSPEATPCTNGSGASSISTGTGFVGSVLCDCALGTATAAPAADVATAAVRKKPRRDRRFCLSTPSGCLRSHPYTPHSVGSARPVCYRGRAM